MNTVGIIGGLGPESTSRFYLTLQHLHANSSQSSRMKALIYSVPVPYCLEESTLTNNNNKVAQYLPLLIEAAMTLEAANVTLIVMPCNTLHCFIQQIRESVSVPVLDMVALVSQYVKQAGFKRAGFKRVGLLATSQTITSEVYHKEFSTSNIHVITPGRHIQRGLDNYIHNQVLNHNEFNHKQSKLAPFIKSVEYLINNDVDIVILGCTELSDLVDQNFKTPVVNSLDILAQAVIDFVVIE
jgi:aspartate racemase